MYIFIRCLDSRSRAPFGSERSASVPYMLSARSTGRSVIGLSQFWASAIGKARCPKSFLEKCRIACCNFRRPERKGRPMSLQLPVSIEQYVQIANSGALEAVPECFAPDAIVHDEGQTY